MKRVIMLVLFLVSCLAAGVHAEVPGLLNYQGVLTDAGGSAVPDGTYEITFRLYNVLSGGTPLWEETQPAVQVTKGIFDVMLGSVMKLELPPLRQRCGNSPVSPNVSAPSGRMRSGSRGPWAPADDCSMFQRSGRSSCDSWMRPLRPRSRLEGAS